MQLSEETSQEKLQGWLRQRWTVCTSRPQTSKFCLPETEGGLTEGAGGSPDEAQHQDLTAHCHLPHRSPGLIEERERIHRVAAGPHVAHEASVLENGEGSL